MQLGDLVFSVTAVIFTLFFMMLEGPNVLVVMRSHTAWAMLVLFLTAGALMLIAIVAMTSRRNNQYIDLATVPDELTSQGLLEKELKTLRVLSVV